MFYMYKPFFIARVSQGFFRDANLEGKQHAILSVVRPATGMKWTLLCQRFIFS